MNPKRLLPSLVTIVLLLACERPSRAQWITQSFQLKAGWNAVYLHVDATHSTLDNLIGTDVTNPIQEIWMWAPPANTAQFVTSPQTPSVTPNWLYWTRSQAPSPSLARLSANVACLRRRRRAK